MMTQVLMQTNHGNITLEIDTENTPKTAENFLQYAEDGFYDGTIFHRVIKQFMIQGGGMDAELSKKETRDEIENEANKGGKNVKGSIAMARTGEPHSASSQFFINTKNNGFLNFRSEDMDGWGYCVFGQVTSGMDIVEKIDNVETGNSGMYQDVPTETVIIEKITVIEAKVKAKETDEEQGEDKEQA